MSTTAVLASIRLNPRNFPQMRRQPRRAFDAIRFDSNNDCNVHCVYCHSPRSDALVDLEEFRDYLHRCVAGVEQFQMGCGMEPTLDARLCDFLEAVAQARLQPKSVRLQTNGILLHRHEPERMAAAGLSVLSVSVDSALAGTHQDLRGGTSLDKVEHNMREFRLRCPAVRLATLTTVTRANIAQLEDLVAWGIELGVTHFTFRQMFHDPDSDLVDHARMRELLAPAPEFAAARQRIQARFGGKVAFGFLDSDTLLGEIARTSAASRDFILGSRPGDRSAPARPAVSQE
jgi:molybdenum cofactor biosynthesis enzyme MoaA